jgi:hypothetical protein
MQNPQELALLQQAADQVVVRSEVKVTSIIAAIFGGLALFGAVTPPMDPLLLVLGALLALVGLWNLTNPHPRGIALIGGCLIVVGLYNIVTGFVTAAGGSHPQVFWQILGVWQIVWGFQAFPRYRRFARAFDCVPGTTRLEQARQSIRDLQRARPKKSPDVIEFIVSGFSPKAGRIRLGPDFVLCLVGAVEDVIVCSPQGFDVEVTGHSALGKSSQVVVHVNGRALKARLRDEHLGRFRAWKDPAGSALLEAA